MRSPRAPPPSNRIGGLRSTAGSWPPGFSDLNPVKMKPGLFQQGCQLAAAGSHRVFGLPAQLPQFAGRPHAVLQFL